MRKSGCHRPWRWWEVQTTQALAHTREKPTPAPAPNHDENPQPVSVPGPIKPFVDLLGSHPSPSGKPYYVSGKSFQTLLVRVSCRLDQILGKRIHPTSVE